MPVLGSYLIFSYHPTVMVGETTTTTTTTPTWYQAKLHNGLNKSQTVMVGEAKNKTTTHILFYQKGLFSGFEFFAWAPDL